ncbi:uncharacterized protein [Anabrus simplex]|uniref:uncharacterized protein isoform X1 n=1 Tax=Anabrus simplex TaxID=316456 RepID=UPI0035A36297
MQTSVNVLLAIAFCLLLTIVMPCYSDPLPREQNNGSRPVRPKVFSSPEELRKYLDDLSDYYAYAGRPRGKRWIGGVGASAITRRSAPLALLVVPSRFGKRLAPPAGFRPSNSYSGASNVPALEAVNSGRYQPTGNANDLYELLFQYDE